MFPAEKLRRRNSPSGSIGSRSAGLVARKQPSSTIPAISGTNTAGLDQPSRGCSISANTEPAEAPAHSSAPGTSTRRPPAARGAAWDRHQDQRHAGGASGMLIRKIHRQEAIASSSPPDQRPEHPGDRAPRRPAADRRPRSDSENVFTITASELGTSSAPATPCSARAAPARRSTGDSAQAERGDAEAPHAEREDPPLAIQVPERASHQDQRAERQQIAVHDPLLRGQRRRPDARWIVGSATFTTSAVEQRDPRAQDAGDQRQALDRHGLRADHHRDWPRAFSRSR
jgi:hypothetical protein